MLVLVIVLSVLLNEATSSKQLTCYYRNWSQYGKGKARFLPADVEYWKLCTIIKYTSLKINMETNTLQTTKPNDAELLAEVNTLKTVKPSLKVVVAIGGWSHEYEPRFSNMAATVETRTTFIQSLVAFLKKHRLDGVSYNWLYPGKRPKGVPANDKEKFTLLFKETLAAFEKEALETETQRFHLSAAVSPSKAQISKSYEVPEIANYVDNVDVMMNSLWGHWKRRTGTAAMEGHKINIVKAIEAWLYAGMPARKVHVGLALYGRTFNLANASKYGLGERTNGPGRAGPHTRKKGILAYYEICSGKWNHITKWSDSSTKTGYASDDRGLWVAYDNVESLAYKVTYLLREYKLGGVTLWSLAFDDFTGQFCHQGRYPLLRGVSDAIDKTKIPIPTCKVAVNLGFILDSSGSLRHNYQKEKIFLKAIASAFGISKDGTRAGVITFSYYVENSIKLKDNFDTHSFNSAVDGIPLMGSTTRIDRALTLAQKVMFTEENGAIAGKPNILVLLTDGSQSAGRLGEIVPDPGVIADELRKEGVVVIVVGIGTSIDTQELERIGGGRHNTFVAPTFKELLQSDIIEDVKEKLCPHKKEIPKHTEATET